MENKAHDHAHDHGHSKLKGKAILIVVTALLLLGAVLIEHYGGLLKWQLLLVYLVPYLVRRSPQKSETCG